MSGPRPTATAPGAEDTSRNAEWRRIIQEHVDSLSEDRELRDAIGDSRFLGVDVDAPNQFPRELQVDCMHTTAVAAATVYSVTLLVGDHYTCGRSKDPYVGALSPILDSWFECVTVCLAKSMVPSVTPDRMALTLWIAYDQRELDISVRSPFGTVRVKDAWGRVDECAERHL